MFSTKENALKQTQNYENYHRKLDEYADKSEDREAKLYLKKTVCNRTIKNYNLLKDKNGKGNVDDFDAKHSIGLDDTRLIEKMREVKVENDRKHQETKLNVQKDKLNEWKDKLNEMNTDNYVDDRSKTEFQHLLKHDTSNTRAGL